MSGKPPLRIKLILASLPNEIVKVEGFLEKLNEQIGFDDAAFNKLLVAATEAVNNGILHGNKKDPSKKVTLNCETDDRFLIVTVEDEGPGLDPAKIPDPLAQENLLRENGRGVFLMRSLMDSIEFVRFQGGSRVIMRIALPA
ncbi:MAG TPA: ATP-binding protein [Bacteroidota bacterium]|nr:ATP-binding protein [Bacteroidota bacterium]